MQCFFVTSKLDETNQEKGFYLMSQKKSSFNAVFTRYLGLYAEGPCLYLLKELMLTDWHQ